jgi:hypothetical protein
MFFYLAQNVAKIEAQTRGDRKRLHVKYTRKQNRKREKIGKKKLKDE